MKAFARILLDTLIGAVIALAVACPTQAQVHGNPVASSTTPTFNTVTTTAKYLSADGAAATPSYSFSSETTLGLYRAGTANLGFATSGQASMLLANGANGQLTLNGGGAFISLAGFAILNTDGSGILSLKNGNAAQEYRVYAGNGGFISNVKSVSESLTIAAAATTVSATSIPAGAILLGVSVRVTTVIPTAATFTVTTTVGGTVLDTAAVSTTANSTDPGTAGFGYRAAATTVTITPNLTPATATGVVRLQFYYFQVTPPTS